MTVAATHLTGVAGSRSAMYVHLRTDHRWKPQRARGATLDVALNGIVAATAERASPSA